MNWRDREKYHAPLLEEEFQIEAPDSFYRSFAIVFGDIRRKADAFFFIKGVNDLMSQNRGGGRVRKEKILNLRGEPCDLNEFVVYDNHHVKPSSRDNRAQICKYDQIVELPERFHAAWHGVFLNLYGKEVILFLERLFHILRKSSEFRYHEFNRHVKNVMEGRVKSRV